ncbi:hypothetical protein BG004_001339, partial [Podila humilis]
HHPNQFIHAIHRGSELLMFDVARVITSLDFTKHTFGFIAKKAVFQDLHFTDVQFLEIFAHDQIPDAGLGTSATHSFYHREVAITYWYDSSISAEHIMKRNSTQAEPTDRWKTGKHLVENELKKQGKGYAKRKFSDARVAQILAANTAGQGWVKVAIDYKAIVGSKRLRKFESLGEVFGLFVLNNQVHHGRYEQRFVQSASSFIDLDEHTGDVALLSHELEVLEVGAFHEDYRNTNVHLSLSLDTGLCSMAGLKNLQDFSFRRNHAHQISVPELD